MKGSFVDKGSIVDSDMSGKEIARALTKLSKGCIHEFVANISTDVVASLLGCAPNLKTIQQIPESSSSLAVGSVAVESLPDSCAETRPKGYLLMVPVQVHQFTSQQSVAFLLVEICF